MEPAPLSFLLLLLLGSQRGCSGRPRDRLAVTPLEPVVPYGSSAQLNCSLACAGGTVQWKGLDTNLGSITSSPTHSILHISSAAVATAGTKICQGICHGQHYQHAVNLQVYALPDRLQLEAEPQAQELGQVGSLRCSARGVYPLLGLRLTWYQGDQVLEEADFEATETDEELFDIVSTLPVAGEEVGEGIEFKCEVTLSIGKETFTRVASVVLSTGAVMEQPVAVATSMRSPQTAVAMTGSTSTARPVTSTALPPEPRVPTHDPSTALTTPRQPKAETIPELAAAPESLSTEHPLPRVLTTGSPTTPPATSMPPGSTTASPPAEAPGAAVESVSWATLPVEMGTMPSVGTEASMGTEPACSLQIWSLPPNGTRGRALRIECHVQCARNVTVRWLQTPVALSQYREEAAGSGSTLSLDHAEPWHQGHYQCVLLGHRSQAVSLQLMVSDDSVSPGPAIATGTTVSLLGLIVTGIMSHRLWKRFRSQYELP